MMFFSIALGASVSPLGGDPDCALPFPLLEEELEGLNVLAGDGSSAEHLAHRLAVIS